MLPELKDFRLKTRLNLRYGDIDMLQHVNNTRYFAFMEDSRIHYAWEVLGWRGENDELNMILAHAEADFIQPIFLFDEIDLYARCSQLGNKSYTFEYLFVRQKADRQEICAKGKAVVVSWDLATQSTHPLPEEIRQKIIAYEPAL